MAAGLRVGYGGGGGPTGAKVLMLSDPFKSRMTALLLRRCGEEEGRGAWRCDVVWAMRGVRGWGRGGPKGHLLPI